jgi:hypothetical protein
VETTVSGHSAIKNTLSTTLDSTLGPHIGFQTGSTGFDNPTSKLRRESNGKPNDRGKQWR